MPVNKYYGDSSYELKDQYLRPIVREELASIVNSNPEFHKLLLKIVNENWKKQLDLFTFDKKNYTDVLENQIEFENRLKNIEHKVYDQK